MKKHLPIAYHDSGVVIQNIEYGIDDKIKWTYYNLSKLNTSRVRYEENGESYFIAYKNKIYLSQCLRYSL